MEMVNLPIEDTIDLHSFRPDEVSGLVKEYLYQAIQKGLVQVRIIHGRGAGIQRRMVHSILRRHPQVIHFEDAEDRGSTSVILTSISHKTPAAAT
ncbi:MAG: Smr/MutS family protein [Acidobacteriota bacterium]